MSDNNVVGVDVGYSNLKVVSGTDINRKPRPGNGAWIWPSGAAPVEYQHEQMPVQGDLSGIRVLLDGKDYVAGVAHDQISVKARVMSPDFASKDTYRALMYAAFVTTQLEEIDTLVTGLPVTQWADPAARQKVAAWLEGAHQVGHGRTVCVKRAHVIAQPMGGFMDFMSSQAGGGGDWANEAMVMVVDPGFYSLDWVVMRDGLYEPQSSGTSNRSVHSILKRVDQLIEQDTGGTYGVERLERAVRDKDKKIFVDGAAKALEPYLQKACNELVPEAIEGLSTALTDAGKQRLIDRVLVVGGGARFFRPYLEKRFGAHKVAVCESPELANARGYWVYGHLMTSQ